MSTRAWWTAALIAIAACGANRHAAMPQAAAPAASDASGMPGDPRTEIDRLDAEITAALAQGGMPTSESPACAAAHTCTAVPMALAPVAEDATCKPAPSDTCTQSCTLSTSICDNAGRICDLANKLGGADAYANEKCARGNESCSRSRERCCGCT